MMSKSAVGEAGAFRGGDHVRRGYHVVYRPTEVNRCPGCGRSQWLVGRASAECGCCATALPLAVTGMTGVGVFRHGHLAGAH